MGLGDILLFTNPTLLCGLNHWLLHKFLPNFTSVSPSFFFLWLQELQTVRSHPLVGPISKYLADQDTFLANESCLPKPANSVQFISNLLIHKVVFKHIYPHDALILCITSIQIYHAKFYTQKSSMFYILINFINFLRIYSSFDQFYTSL